MTDNATPDWRRIADDRLGKLAAIARIGAEPPEAVLAIIRETDLPPDAGTSDTSTIYHESIREFRASLVSDAYAHRKVKKRYGDRITALRKGGGKTSEEVADAHVGNLMAAEYAYALAAVLRVAEDRLGPQSARLLANCADDILSNGDDNDLNADVKPGTPLPPPTDAEQMQAGQLTVFEPEAVGCTTGDPAARPA